MHIAFMVIMSSLYGYNTSKHICRTHRSLILAVRPACVLPQDFKALLCPCIFLITV